MIQVLVKYEKPGYKQDKLKLDFAFLTNYKNLVYL